MTAWLCGLLSGAAMAQPLSLDTVLESVDTRVPAVQAQALALDQAEARLRQARGVNAPVLQGSWTGDPNAPQVADTTLSLVQPTALGPSVALGWAGGPAGTPSAELSLPLLDGLLWGAPRLELVSARLERSIASAQTEFVVLKAQVAAAEDWWAWVFQGQKLQIAQQQLALAEQRHAALERAVALGQRPRLQLVDNQRVLLSRQAQTVAAAQGLESAAVDLSLWWRDAQAQPQVPLAAQLPDTPALDAPLLDLDAERAVLANRPDLVALDLALDLADAERRKALNAALPTLDLQATLTPQELRGGVGLELPLGVGTQRAVVSEAEAEVQRLQAVRRGAMDTLEAELVQSHQRVLASWERVGIARQAEALAHEALEMERSAYALGGSEVFRLVQREAQLASAQSTRVDAEQAYARAQLQRALLLGTGPR